MFYLFWLGSGWSLYFFCFLVIAQLSSLGVNPNALTFKSTTMESDRYVVVCERGDNGETSLLLVDTANPTKPLRRPMQADAAVMNPLSKVIAFQTGSHLTLFDFTTKANVKSFTSNESIVLIRWAGETLLAIVTSAAVYHWNTDDSQEPQRIFERHPTLSNAQITGYKVDKSKGNPQVFHKISLVVITHHLLTLIFPVTFSSRVVFGLLRSEWCALFGMTNMQDGSVRGNIQLYSVTKGLTQPIEGHAATFANIMYEGYDTTLFAFAAKTAKGSKMYVIEVGHDKKPQGAPKFGKKEADVFCPPEMANDFPIALQVRILLPLISQRTGGEEDSQRNETTETGKGERKSTARMEKSKPRDELRSDWRGCGSAACLWELTVVEREC